MVDLSHLGGLKPVEQLDLGNYAENKERTFRLAPKGVYTLQAPDQFPAEAFSRTKGDSLQAQIDPTIVGPTNEGTVVKYVKVSAKTFPRGKGLASQVGDYLVACGFRGVLQNEKDIAEAIASTAGSVYQAKLDWSAYNKRTGWRLDGMEKFPKLPDGTYQPWAVDPSEVGKTVDGQPIADSNGNPILDENGQPRRQARVFANLTIPFGGFIPAAE
jgi:hypothetical protein